MKAKIEKILKDLNIQYNVVSNGRRQDFLLEEENGDDFWIHPLSSGLQITYWDKEDGFGQNQGSVKFDELVNIIKNTKWKLSV